MLDGSSQELSEAIRLLLDSLADVKVHLARSIQILDMVDFNHCSWLVVLPGPLGLACLDFQEMLGISLWRIPSKYLET